MIELPNDFYDSLSRISRLDHEALVKALGTPPVTGVRFNRRKHPDAANSVCQVAGTPTDGPVDWCDNGIYLTHRPLFTLDPLLHAGAYYVQDPSSMIVQQIIARIAAILSDDPSSTLTVLDFCAAPGGKTTAIINALPDASTVVANEFVATRGKILRENLEKWGYPWVITTGSPSSRYRELRSLFDIVVVDAPCSGEGMMRKDEEARRQWSETLVRDCASLQRTILDDIANTVRPGGYLIYSTCTFNTLEDEENSLYISRNLGLSPVSPDEIGLTGIEKVGHSLMPGTEGLRFMPHLTRGEGLYISIFRKPHDTSTPLATGTPDAPILNLRATASRKNRNAKGAGMRQNELPAELRRLADCWVADGIDPHFELSGNMLTMLPGNSVPILEALRNGGVNITGAGLPIAELKKGAKKTELIPDSRFALSCAMKQGIFPEAELTEDDAIRYLRRDSITPDANIPKGFVVVKYKGFSLGLIKNLGSRANNLYPLPWRIHLTAP